MSLEQNVFQNEKTGLNNIKKLQRRNINEVVNYINSVRK